MKGGPDIKTLDVFHILIKIVNLLSLIVPILIAFIKKKYQIIAIEVGIVACLIAIYLICDHYLGSHVMVTIFLLFNILPFIFSLVAPIVIAFTSKKYEIILAAAIIVACIHVAFSLCPTCFPYVDCWIMGKTRDEITAVYGEPTGYNWKGMISYNIGNDTGFWGIMSSNLDMHYYIDFDQNGEACDIYYGCQLGG